jgi:hypothetical protein
MALFCLFYRGIDKPAGIVITEASSEIEARKRAIEKGLETGVSFATAQMLNDELSAMVRLWEINRLLPLNEANQIIERFERAPTDVAPRELWFLSRLSEGGPVK